MDAHLYKAVLWCGPCTIKMLVAERKAAPGAIEMPTGRSAGADHLRERVSRRERL